MFKKGLVLTSLSFLLTVPSFAITLPQYEIIDLGTLPGGISSWSTACSINNNNQIVGYTVQSYPDFTVPFYATLFDATGGGNNIDLGGAYSEANSNNNNDQIVGQSRFGPYGDAAVFDPDGPELNLNPDHHNSTTAMSINDNGQIVGFRFVAGGIRAMYFDPTGAGNNIKLGTLGGNFSRASCINNNGWIVGEADNLSQYQRAVLFDPTGAGNNIDLGTLGGNTSRAHSINNSNQIVGYAQNSSKDIHATLFDPTGGGNNIDLGTIDLGAPSLDISAAYDINDKGQIVGRSGNRAVLFDPTGAGNNINLNTLLPEGSGWTLYCANSINDNGWIVGYGKSPSGQHQHAFLLKPVPEPATISLLLLGSLTALRRKRK